MPRNTIDIISQYAKTRQRKGKTTINVFLLGDSASQPVVRTDAGPDGVVQPDRPVMMVNTLQGPRLIHEDEVLRRNADGTVTVTPSEQTRLMALQQAGLKGFQYGGRYTPFRVGTTTPQNTISPTSTQNSQYVPWFGQNTRQPSNYSQPGTSIPTNQTNGTNTIPESLQRTKVPYGISDSVKRVPSALANFSVPFFTSQSRQAVTTTDKQITPPTTTQPAPSQPAPTTSTTQPAEPQPAEPVSGTITQPASQRVEVAVPPRVGTLAPIQEVPVSAQQPQAPDVGARAAATGAMSEGLSMIRDIARGESDLDKRIRQYYLGSWNMQAAAEDARLRQQLAAQGRTPDEINAIMLARQRDRDVARSEMFSKMGIQESARAEQAARDLVTQGAGIRSEERAQETWEDQQRNAAEATFTGYVQTQKAADPNYNWREDQYAVNLANEVWRRAGMSGDLDYDWADRITTAVTTSPSDMWINTVRNSAWYKNADAAKRQTYDSALQVIAQTFDLNGSTIGQDKRGNTIIRGPDGGILATIAPDGTTSLPPAGSSDNYQTEFTGDLNNDDDVAAYAKQFDTTFIVPGEISTEAMRAYLQSHKDEFGDPVGPSSAEDWIKWSKTDRSFNINSQDDILSAVELAREDSTVADAAVQITTAGMKLWLAQNNGKWGKTEDMVEFFRTAPDYVAIRGYFTNDPAHPNLSQAQSANVAKMLSARTLLEQYRAGTFTTNESWRNALTAAGFPVNTTIATLEAWSSEADRILPQAGNVNDLNNLILLVDVHRVDTGGYVYFQQSLSNDALAWAKANAGKTLNWDGKQLVLTGKTANKKTKRREDIVDFYQGIMAYDPSTGKEYVIYSTSNKPGSLKVDEFQTHQKDSIRVL